MPVSGSRTWMWTTAAPALAASIADVAICSGLTGTCGLLPTVLPDPVTAQVMKTSQFIACPLWCRERPVSCLNGQSANCSSGRRSSAALDCGDDLGVPRAAAQVARETDADLFGRGRWVAG